MPWKCAISWSFAMVPGMVSSRQRNVLRYQRDCTRLMHALVSHSRRNWLYGLCCFVCAKGCEGLPQSMICSTCAVRMAACNMRMHEILPVEWCIESLNVVVTLSLRSKWINKKLARWRPGDAEFLLGRMSARQPTCEFWRIWLKGFI